MGQYFDRDTVIERSGQPFVKTFLGSLFTYQFASVWLDTEAMGMDNHATRPMNLFENTQQAVDALRAYTSQNPTNRVTWSDGRGETLWGVRAGKVPLMHTSRTACPRLPWPPMATL